MQFRNFLEIHSDYDDKISGKKTWYQFSGESHYWHSFWHSEETSKIKDHLHTNDFRYITGDRVTSFSKKISYFQKTNALYGKNQDCFMKESDLRKLQEKYKQFAQNNKSELTAMVYEKINALAANAKRAFFYTYLHTIIQRYTRPLMIETQCGKNTIELVTNLPLFNINVETVKNSV